MSRIDTNNPLTWNKPRYKTNSCYANSSLWALLYNDVYIDLIKGTSLMPNSDAQILGYEGEIQSKLIEFYNAIHSIKKMSRDDVYSITENIRNYLSLYTTNNGWKTRAQDPEEFLRNISNIFENINNCDINSNLLPLIRVGVTDLDITAREKNVRFSEFGDKKSCDFNIHDGLIVQYGDHLNITEEKYYLIGKYKLYAFSHWFGDEEYEGGHYNCYFDFNNKWYIFDDINTDIIEVTRVERKTIYNDSFLFFYKFDESIPTDINVTLTEYFASDDRTLSIIDNDESPASRPRTPQSQKSAAAGFDSDEWESYNDFPETKNWLTVFNRCNEIKVAAPAGEVAAQDTNFGGTKRKQIIKCKSSKKNRNYNKRKKTRKNKKIKKHKKSRKNVN